MRDVARSLIILEERAEPLPAIRIPPGEGDDEGTMAETGLKSFGFHSMVCAMGSP